MSRGRLEYGFSGAIQPAKVAVYNSTATRALGDGLIVCHFLEALLLIGKEESVQILTKNDT